MKTRLFILSAILLLFYTGCSKDNELKKSVFIKDSEFTDLPAYSEWGYNNFGAYYDREIFVSNDYLVPAKVIATDSSISFILDGQKGRSTYYSEYTEMSLTFMLQGFAPRQYEDLTTLNDSVIDLKNPACQVHLSVDTLTYRAVILSGMLTIKRVQNLMVDKQPVEAILSGYFEFKALINDKPVTMSDGRFDVGIGIDNFYHNP